MKQCPFLHYYLPEIPRWGNVAHCEGEVHSTQAVSTKIFPIILCRIIYSMTPHYLWKLRLNLSPLGQMSYSIYTSETITPDHSILSRKLKTMGLN